MSNRQVVAIDESKCTVAVDDNPSELAARAEILKEFGELSPLEQHALRLETSRGRQGDMYPTRARVASQYGVSTAQLKSMGTSLLRQFQRRFTDPE